MVGRDYANRAAQKTINMVQGVEAQFGMPQSQPNSPPPIATTLATGPSYTVWPSTTWLRPAHNSHPTPAPPQPVQYPQAAHDSKSKSCEEKRANSCSPGCSARNPPLSPAKSLRRLNLNSKTSSAARASLRSILWM